MSIDSKTQTEIEAATFRKLRDFLQENTDVQNIDLMILADFCRNCLGDWYREAAETQGINFSKEDARERIYGMPYSKWKAEHQKPATDAQLTALDARKTGH